MGGMMWESDTVSALCPAVTDGIILVQREVAGRKEVVAHLVGIAPFSAYCIGHSSGWPAGVRLANMCLWSHLAAASDK